jgi:hypothetical protein
LFCLKPNKTNKNKIPYKKRIFHSSFKNKELYPPLLYKKLRILSSLKEGPMVGEEEG